MLRHVILTNFIHFQGQEVFNFQPGCTLFIGENNSGKSSVFEAARRCLSFGQNTSLSNPHCQDRLSSSICVFDIDDGCGNSGNLVSANIRLPNDDKKRDSLFIKVAYETLDRTVGMDLVKESNAKKLVNENVPYVDYLIGEFNTFLNFKESPTKQEAETLMQNVATFVYDKIQSFNENTESSTIQRGTKCEEILDKFLDDKIVFTFAVRGIGPCQWSLSERVNQDEKAHNYETAMKRAEILQWYLTKKCDQDTVEQYFQIITDNSCYTFECEASSKQLLAYDTRARAHIPILKVPEGILEAMNCAILLGVSRFKTVCLEEPEKGMHPQMIDRMRDLVLRKIKNKVIIITSHHPQFLCPWTISSLYIFKRRENDNGTAFKVYSGSSIDEKQSEKAHRTFTTEHLAPVFFARRVFFVEGTSEYILMTAMKEFFLDTKSDKLVLEMMKRCIASQNQSVDNLDLVVKRFRNFLCTLQILDIGGKKSTYKFYKLCCALDLENYFLLDNDAKEIEFFVKKYDSAQMGDVSNFEEDGFFLWKTGDIEDVFIQYNKHDRSDLKCLFERNNTPLKRKSENKKRDKNQYKLFLNKDLTDKNISTVTENIFMRCLEPEDSNEIWRLVLFLFNGSNSIHSLPT